MTEPTAPEFDRAVGDYVAALEAFRVVLTDLAKVRGGGLLALAEAAALAARFDDAEADIAQAGLALSTALAAARAQGLATYHGVAMDAMRASALAEAWRVTFGLTPAGRPS